MSDFLFTSESVSEGHLDKVADQISDAVLDAILEQDSTARVVAETLVTRGLVLLTGKIATTGEHDYASIARAAIRRIGYNDPDLLFDADSCEVMVRYEPPDGSGRAADDSFDRNIEDGGIGTAFGYACDETRTLMPLAIHCAHRIVQRHGEIRRDGRLSWLRPDARSQVTLRYVDGKPATIDTVVLAVQHHPRMSDKREELAEAAIDLIVKPSLPSAMLDGTRYLINPSGRLETGGPRGTVGMSGRQVNADSYGGACPAGGGLSGKDPSNVDRAAAYAARYIAKNIVAAGIATRCQVQLSYAVGIADPVNMMIRTEGTGLIPEWKISELVRGHFELGLTGIVRMLDLSRPVYSKTAAYGHFGRDEPEFTWENTDKAGILRRAAGL